MMGMEFFLPRSEVHSLINLSRKGLYAELKNKIFLENANFTQTYG